MLSLRRIQKFSSKYINSNHPDKIYQSLLSYGEVVKFWKKKLNEQ